MMISRPTIGAATPTRHPLGETSFASRQQTPDAQIRGAAGIDSRPTTQHTTPMWASSGGTQLAGRHGGHDAQNEPAAGIDPRLGTAQPIPISSAPSGAQLAGRHYPDDAHTTGAAGTDSRPIKTDSTPTFDASGGIQLAGRHVRASKSIVVASDGTASPATMRHATPRAGSSRGIEDETPGHVANVEPTPKPGSLHDPALVFAADILDDLETVRTANENRLRQMTRSVEDSDGEIRGLGYDETHPDVARLAAMVDALRKLEHDAELNLARHLRRHPLGNWVKAQRGIGEKQAARLLAAIGDPYIRPEWTKADGTVVPEGPRTVSALWAYCGLHVLPVNQFGIDSQDPDAGRVQFPTDQKVHDDQGVFVGGDGSDPSHGRRDTQSSATGVAPKRARNQQSNWSETARKRIWLVADACRKQLVKPCIGITDDAYAQHVDDCQCSPYRLIYDAGRLKYAHAKHETPCVRCGPKGKPAEVGTPLSAAHQDARARRLVMKEILKDLWREAKQLHEQR